MAKLPHVTSKVDRDIRQFIDRVREGFEAQQKLIDALQIKANELASSQASQGQTLTEVTAAVGTGTASYTIETPSAPTGLTALGALANVIVSWDEPAYSGHSHTEIWAAPARDDGGSPALGDASLVGMAPGRVFAHNLGNSATRWYWVRFVNINDLAGPYNAVVGLEASTSPDPAYLLELLSGQITESQLFQDLGERIDLIDADVSTPGSVSARVQAEADARSTETGDLFAQYTVKVDVNGYVSGYGLASSEVDGTPSSQFIVRADSFSIGTPGGTTPAPSVPFIVRTTPTTINGQSVPAGTYIQDAYIADGTISNAKIGIGVIDEAHIANATILDAYISQLTADQINTNGLTIKDEFGNVILGSGTGLDWSNVAGTGKPADNADVTSANTAAAISGQGSLATRNTVSTTFIDNLAVNTAKIAGNAVTVPDYAESGTFSRSGGAASWSYDVFSTGTRPTVSLNVTAPVLIVWMVEQGYALGDSPRWAWRVTKNGSVIDSRTSPMFGQNDQPSGCFLTSCSAGTNYFNFDWYGDAQTGSITAVIKMWVMAAQK